MDVGVVGCGYVGLVVAASLAAVGHRVVAVEVDPDRRARLRDGRVPFHEPGLADLIRSPDLRFVGQIEATDGLPVVFVAVPTPDDPADPGFAALDEVADRLAALPSLGVVVVKSTVTPATVDRWVARFPGSLVVNPEFLREGRAVEDFRRPARVVLGGPPEAVERVLEVYVPLYGDEIPVLRTDGRSAALLKLAANAMLAVRVSFANELARLASAVGADGRAVLEGVGLDPRIGPSHLGPSLGYGGACLPKDTRRLADVGRAARVRQRVVEAADRANEAQRDVVLAAVRGLLASDGNDASVPSIPEPSEGEGPTTTNRLAGRRVAVWGLAFKAGTDDLRSSASVAVVERLRAEGATVAVHDPLVADGDPVAVAEGAEVLIVGTAWPGYAAVDPGEVRAARKIAVDPGGVLGQRWVEAGWRIWP